MYASVLVLKGGYAHFLLVLTTLQPILSDWLNDVKENQLTLQQRAHLSQRFTTQRFQAWTPLLSHQVLPTCAPFLP
jgi:hypothetical protein